MFKTGSTSIQNTLFRLNAEIPWVYLNIGTPNSSIALQTMFRRQSKTAQVSLKRGLDRAEQVRRKHDYFKRMEEQINATDKDLFLSGEGMCVFSEMELQRLIAWLSRFVDEIVAVGYVRPPKAYMESAFQQIVKGGYSKFTPNAVYPNYRKKFEKFENLLGRDRVQYWLFDPKAFQHGCVVRDFASRLGVTLKERHVKRVNESLSREDLAMLYCYRKYGDGNRIGGEAVKQDLLLIKKLGELEGHKLRFSPDLVRPILEARRSDIAWMEERLGQPFKEDLTARTELGVADENDLLQVDEASLNILCDWLGVSPVVDMGTKPAEVARLIGQLRCKIASERKKPAVRQAPPGVEVAGRQGMPGNNIGHQRGRAGEDVYLKALFQKAKEAHPGEFDRINENEAVALLRAAFSEIKQQIELADEGVITVPSLGDFRGRRVIRDAGGKKASQKKIFFHATK
ncbi:MAG: hypothetical protein AB1591_11275 [Pseudomonadota bacterium]